MFWWLVGCPFVTGPQYEANVQDADGDGFISTRFGGPDCRDSNASITTCDADGDGHAPVGLQGDDCDDDDPNVYTGAPEICDGVDNDCDGAVDNADPDVSSAAPVFVDRDGDGFGDADQPRACQENPPHATVSGDCDDNDAHIGPFADELCDGVDNDCDGVTDDVGVWLIDDDGDGYGRDGTQAVGNCTLQPGDGVSDLPGDCDDTDPSISPAADEMPYDGVDSNCNGLADDWDADFDHHVPAEHFAAAQASAPNAGFLLGDCNDEDPRQNDGAHEVCDNVDNDCDGSVDSADLQGAGPADEPDLRLQVGTWYTDLDGDGSAGTEVLLCPQEVHGHSLTLDDCDDDDASISPAEEETCNGVDDDCDGLQDHAIQFFPGSIPMFLDNDGDGFGVDAVFGCGRDALLGLALLGEDCNDAQIGIFPDAPEICGDAVRQDCSSAHIFDCDGDGHQGLYQGGGTGDDCDDLQPLVNLDQPLELCDGVDNDCDGLVDSADLDNLDAGTEPFWFVDADGDGFGIDDGSQIQQCDAPSNRALLAGDCDDSDAALSPSTPWYADGDGDGFGDDSTAIEQCTPPSLSHVLLGADCDDSDPLLNPGALWRVDNDDDGFGAGPAVAACTPPPGTVTAEPADCDDEEPLRSPGQPEIPGDGIDNDCDGTIDGASGVLWYPDLDGDGFGDELAGGVTSPGPHLVTNNLDCNDSEATANPAVIVELCDGLDNNCDGLHIGGDPDVSNPDTGVDILGPQGSVLFVEQADHSYALDYRVTTCNLSLGGVLEGLDDGPRDASLPFDVFMHLLDCDGVAGTIYADDSDGDGFPVDDLDTYTLVCPTDPVPPFKVALVPGESDCAPDDGLRWQLSVPFEFADLDQDGNLGVVPAPSGTCVGHTSNTAGPDCDDQQPGDAVPASVTLGPSDNLTPVVTTCNDAHVYLPDGAYGVEAAVFADRTGARLRFHGVPGTTVSVQGSATTNMELSFEDLDLVGQGGEALTLGADARVSIYGGQDRLVTDLSFVVTLDAALQMVSREVVSQETPFTVSGGEASVLRSTIISHGDGANLVSGELTLEDVELFGGGILHSGGELDLMDTFVAGGTFRQTGGDATFTEVEWITGDGTAALLVDGGDLTCQRCDLEHEDAGVAVEVLPNGTVQVEDSTLTSEAAAVVNAGSFTAVGSTLEGGMGAQAVLISTSDSTLVDTFVQADGQTHGVQHSAGFLSGSNVLIVDATGGLLVDGGAAFAVQALTVAQVPANGQAVVVDGGFGTLEGLSIDEHATGVLGVQVFNHGFMELRDAVVRTDSTALWVHRPAAAEVRDSQLVTSADVPAVLNEYSLEMRGSDVEHLGTVSAPSTGVLHNVGHVADPAYGHFEDVQIRAGQNDGLVALSFTEITGDHIDVRNAHFGFDLKGTFDLEDISAEVGVDLGIGVYLFGGPGGTIDGVDVTHEDAVTIMQGMWVHDVGSAFLSDLNIRSSQIGFEVYLADVVVENAVVEAETEGVVVELGTAQFEHLRVLATDGVALQVVDAVVDLTASRLVSEGTVALVRVDEEAHLGLERVTLATSGAHPAALMFDDHDGTPGGSLQLERSALDVPVGSDLCGALALPTGSGNLLRTGTNQCGFAGAFDEVVPGPLLDAGYVLIDPAQRAQYGEFALP